MNFLSSKHYFYIEQIYVLYRAKILLYRAKILFISSIQFAPIELQCMMQEH
jgi:hypothetical protein